MVEEMKRLDNLLNLTCKIVNGVGVSFQAIMMGFISADVILRKFFNMPITGSIDIAKLMLVVAVFFGIAYTQVEEGHVNITLLTERFPKRVQAVIDSCVYFIGLGLFSVMTWQTVLAAIDLKANGTTTTVLPIPIYPFYFVVALGCALLSLVLLSCFIKSLKGGPKK
jgi:TRAP-type C4-dicarboxylate transport system permease small subunit